MQAERAAHKKAEQIHTNKNKFQCGETDILVQNTDPKGGKPPACGNDPSSGVLAGDGARAPFGCPHEWSTNKVLISGLGLGFYKVGTANSSFIRDAIKLTLAGTIIAKYVKHSTISNNHLVYESP